VVLQILRLLDNEAIEAEDLEDTKTNVADYIESNQEEFDFYACPDDSYADVLEQLDNLEVDPPPPRVPALIRAPLHQIGRLESLSSFCPICIPPLARVHCVYQALHATKTVRWRDLHLATPRYLFWRCFGPRLRVRWGCCKYG